ncbi:ArsR/SmtB family transcription factor [Vallitalea okinawensis]|uniref:ArsR/SmtB family transcription factor n=1 Tax=Vallitalea okinawensis TaxID=2078660 RepID=UPI000CFAF642|nr:ArsR family transcriptional regulator [Vallitalea okinawensis]
MKINVDTENLEFFQCFSSETRLKMIELIRDEPRNIGELAGILNISSTIVARHINMLQKAGVVEAENLPGKRGLQKKCKLILDEVTLDFKLPVAEVPQYESLEIPVGHFSNYLIQPTCGIASKEKLIGIVDDPRYFSNPERMTGSILWFQNGWIEYKIPSYLLTPSATYLEISLELCSEYPHYKNDYPSDIYFYINSHCLGKWMSPGDFGDKRGIYTPDWWSLGTQYGLLKTIRVTKEATYIDGNRLSDVTIEDLLPYFKEDLTLRIAAPQETEHPGGITLFGQGFGNYPQDIIVKVG